jgi:hypothetical protein
LIDGAVWLHRKILESSIWTTSHATRSGFITCLLLANYKDQQWYSRAEHKQVVIARGAFFTTLEKFGSVSGLSLQQTRDCLKTLEDLDIITCRRTQRGTFITILNYDDYQKLGTRRGTDIGTQKEHKENTIGTWLEESKESKERKEGGNPPIFSLEDFTAYWQTKPKYEKDQAKIAMGLKAYKLSFRVEEDIYNKIMGKGDDNGTVRNQSISEQVAERVRQGKLERPGKTFGEISARLRGVQDVSSKPETSA